MCTLQVPFAEAVPDAHCPRCVADSYVSARGREAGDGQGCCCGKLAGFVRVVDGADKDGLVRLNSGSLVSFFQGWFSHWIRS